MLDQHNDTPQFLGMGFAGTEIPTINQQTDSLILPDTVERPVIPPKGELGFHAIKARDQQRNSQSEHFGIGAQSNKGR